MSPEEIDEQVNYIISDIWSLGVTIIEMITQMNPFQGETRTQVKEKISRGSYELSKNFSHDLKGLLKKMLEIDVDKRYDAHNCLMHPWINE